MTIRRLFRLAAGSITDGGDADADGDTGGDGDANGDGDADGATSLLPPSCAACSTHVYRHAHRQADAHVYRHVCRLA